MASHTDIADVLERLSRTTGPGARAYTMPPAFYLSPEMLDLERRAIFEGQWLCVGHRDQVATPGDFFTREVAGEPLLVVHGADGRIRALSNVCRHRSNLIASGTGNRRRFTCGYHAWTYGLDGSLERAPHMGAGLDRASCALPEFALCKWNGFVFVDVAGTAPALGPELGPMSARLDGRHLGERRPVHHAREVWDTNWKCLVENFLEGYHLSVTHARTLHPFTPTRGCRKFPGAARFTGYDAFYDEARLRGTVYEQGAAPEERFSILFGVFPQFLITVGPRYGFYLSLIPLDAGRVEVDWGAFCRPGHESDAATAEYVALVDRVNQEDRAKLENVQRGLRSRTWRPVPLAPADLEGTIADFHRYVAGRVLASGARPRLVSA